jgi:hypothetical protein
MATTINLNNSLDQNSLLYCCCLSLVCQGFKHYYDFRHSLNVISIFWTLNEINFPKNYAPF